MQDIVNCKDILKFANEIIGQDGGIKLDTGILHHFCYDENEQDIKVIGTMGVPIIMQDIIDTFEKIENDSKFSEAFNSERSFFFDGITKNGKRYYSILWSS